MNAMPSSRIDKLLSSMGYGSRSDIARIAKAGGITLDGVILSDVTRRISVGPDLQERMMVRGQALDILPGMLILLNKPVGMICSHKEAGPLVYDLLPERWRRRDPMISTVGRLDRDTSGLLLMTDDGKLLHRIISPNHRIRKVYRATLARPLKGTEAAVFASGELMLKGETKSLAPADLEVISDTEVLIGVFEGRYHQVRRMFAAVGNHVEILTRERLGGLVLPKDLAPGEWTVLGDAEAAMIFRQDGAEVSEAGVLGRRVSQTRPDIGS